jgi:hypothetical protein
MGIGTSSISDLLYQSRYPATGLSLFGTVYVEDVIPPVAFNIIAQGLERVTLGSGA